MEVIKKHKEMKEVYVTDEHYTICDKCGQKIHTNYYDAFNFKFSRRTGTEYPEGGSGEEETLDLCQDCSIKIVHLLKVNGYNVQFKEWDW
jgi:hypothetical protein